MTDLDTLLRSDPIVATAGVAVLADAIEAQAGEVGRTEWRPPTPGTSDALAALAVANRTWSANRSRNSALLRK